MERFAVIGLGRFGSYLAEQLAAAGAEVIAVDRQRDLVEAIRDRVALAVCLDSTDEEALRAQGIDKVDVAIVGVGTDFESCALTTVILKQLGVPRVISRATGPVREQILSRIGANAIINPERESAERWRNRLIAPAIKEQIELAEGFSLVQLAAPARFVGKTMAQLALRTKYGVNVVALRRTTEEIDTLGQTRSRQVVVSVPLPDSVIQDGDVLLVIGSDEALTALGAD